VSARLFHTICRYDIPRRYWRNKYLVSQQPQHQPQLSQLQNRQLQWHQAQPQRGQLPICGVGLRVGFCSVEEFASRTTVTTPNIPVRVRIRRIHPGLSAEASGVLREGDLVLAVDGQSLHALPMSTIHDRIIGLALSTVLLTVQRPDRYGTPMSGVEFDVLLVRLPSPYPPRPQ